MIREDGLCALVIALGALELTGLQRWEQGGEIACGSDKELAQHGQ
jgi:hypothetical protein